MAPLNTFGPQQAGGVSTLDFGVYNFSGGLNVKATLQEMADTELVQALNGYLRADGGFQMRRGYTVRNALTGSSVKGLLRFYQGVVNGALASTKYLLAQVGDNLVNADTNTVIGSLGTNTYPWSALVITNPDPLHYAGPTDVAIICTGSGGPYVWDGTNLYTPAGWSSAADARWCAAVNGIVWFGGIKAQPNRVSGAGSGQVAGDSFEVAGTFREFIFSQPVMGLKALGDGATGALAVGLNKGIGILTGTTPFNFSLQETPADDGVMSGYTMQVFAGTLYYLGRQAMYAYNGSGAPTQISVKIEPWILNDPLASGQFPFRGTRANTFAFIYNNRYHLFYDYTGGGSMTACVVYDLVLQGWTNLLTVNAMQAACLLDAPDDPSPAACVIGGQSTPDVYLWDQLDGSNNATDAGSAFQTVVQTKYFKLGEPGTTKAVYRVYPELFVSGAFSGFLGLYTDYGANTSFGLATVTKPNTTGSLWGTGVWGTMFWSSSAALSYYGYPNTRADFPGTQADAHSFVLYSNTAIPPWILAGFTGVYQQQAKV